MLKMRKPKIGVLALMQGLYDESQPEIPANQTIYMNEVLASLDDQAEWVFPGLSKERWMTEKYVKEFNNQDLDGIMIVNTLYSPGLRLVQAFKQNKLPVMCANIQPLPSVHDGWNWSLLTTNQGIHGIQDTCSMLMRLGVKPAIITEDWKSDNFKTFVGNWAQAAATAKDLRNVRIAVMEKMKNMGDILGDEVAFFRVFGIEVLHESIGKVAKLIETITDEEIDAQIAEDYKNYEVSADIPEKNHRYAAKIQLAFEKFCNENDYDGFSANFDAFGGDGRFEQLPILGACNMLAKNYVYAAEGDIHVMTLEAMGDLLIGDSHFTEMYSLDFERDACMFAHMGEGNPAVARKDRPVTLIDRPLDIGGLDNPPTPIFSAEVGVATVASLLHLEGDKYRMVAMKGVNLDDKIIPGIPMNHTFFKPDSGVKAAMDGWLKYGGTHHEVMWIGDHMDKLKKLCDILDIEFVEV